MRVCPFHMLQHWQMTFQLTYFISTIVFIFFVKGYDIHKSIWMIFHLDWSVFFLLVQSLIEAYELVQGKQKCPHILIFLVAYKIFHFSRYFIVFCLMITTTSGRERAEQHKTSIETVHSLGLTTGLYLGITFWTRQLLYPIFLIA